MKNAISSRGRALALAATLAGTALMTLAGPAPAQQTQVVGPWDGTNPFSCTNRNGSKRRRAIRRLHLTHGFRAGGVGVFEAPRRPGRRLFVGIGGKRVKWLAVSDPQKLRSRATKQLLRWTAAG